MSAFAGHPRRITWPTWAGGAALLLLLWLGAKRLAQAFPEAGALNGDAYWTYLPNARKFLAAPWQFLTTDPASYYVAPLGYIWPALWGADQIATQWANSALFLASLLLLWTFVKQVGGQLAAFISCALLAGHPELTHYAPQVLTESPYLFGFSLTFFGIGKALTQPRQAKWLGLIAFGLTITLLTRPVLQYMLLVALALCIFLSTFGRFKQTARNLTLALLVSLALPAAVIVKNGVYFDVWKISTGSGAGLFYGLSPHRSGAEPLYSNFSYDAYAVAYVIAPESQGHPLAKNTDEINRAVALEVVKQTRWVDNMEFLGRKLSMWLFTSTPELYINPNLRWIRLSEWMSITCCMGLLLFRRKNLGIVTLPGNCISTRQKALLFAGMLAGVLIMAVQLSPVLYNGRYANYFIEPWLMVLAGWSSGYLLLGRWGLGNENWYWLGAAATLVSLIAVANALTQHAVRREIWEIDTTRPGPTKVLLPSSDFPSPHPDGMRQTAAGSWEITHMPATLRVAVNGAQIPEQVQDAMWRMRLAVRIPDSKPSSQCVKAAVSVVPHHPERGSYSPPPLIFLRTDGRERDYILAANGASRPRGAAEITIAFHCPVGTQITWRGIELRQSTLTDAGIDFLKNGTVLNPYLLSPLTPPP